MIEYIVVGALIGAFGAAGIVLLRRVIQSNAAKKAARAEHAHSEPGGPRTHRHSGASGDAAARLADRNREGWGG